MPKLFTIPQRKLAAGIIREVASKAFGAASAIPPVVQMRYGGAWHIATGTARIETAHGPADWSVSCSEGLLHVYCQYVGPMTDDRREMARRLGGNTYSGKVNWWWSPDRRIAHAASFQMAIEDAGMRYASFVDRIKTGA